MYHYYGDGDVYCESCALALCENQEEVDSLGDSYSIISAADRIIRCEGCGEHWDIELTDEGFEQEIESLARTLENPEDFVKKIADTAYIHSWAGEGKCFLPDAQRGELVGYTADLLYKHIGYNTDWRSEIFEKTLGQIGELLDHGRWIEERDLFILKVCGTILKTAQKLHSPIKARR